MRFVHFVTSATAVAVLAAFVSATGSYALSQRVSDDIRAERTANSKSWHKTDGGVITEISTGAIHYKDTDGSWQDINTAISPPARPGFAYSVVKNPVKVHFSGTARGKIALDAEEVSVSFAVLVDSDTAGVTDGSTITYPSAWADTDLKYTVIPEGLKEDIILKRQPKLCAYTFALDCGTLTPVKLPDGTIELRDTGGTPHVFIPPSFMQDAKGNVSREVSTVLEQTAGGWSLTVIPDAEWLASAAYPVAIDPTYIVEQGGSGYYTSAYTTSDTCDWVYGSYVLSLSGSNSSAVPSAYVHFPISSSLTNITHARVVLTADTPCAPCNVEMRRVNAGWGSEPPPQSTALMTRSWNYGYQQVFETTNLVSTINGWRMFPSTNFGLEWHVADSGSVGLSFYSGYATDVTKRPKLVVECGVTATPPAAPQNVYDGPTADLDYTNVNIGLQWHWDAAVDTDDGIRAYKYAIGTTPGGNDVVLEAWTTSTNITLPQTLPDGAYYLTVWAQNSAYQLSSPITTDGIAVDTVAPRVSGYLSPPDTNGNATLTYTSTDPGGSGINTVLIYRMTDGLWVFQGQSSSASGTFTVSNAQDDSEAIALKAVDNAGNDSGIVMADTTPLDAPIIYVNAACNNLTHDGQSWQSAFTTVQAGVDAANANTPRGQVWVAAGTYHEHITLYDGVALYGGFNGTELARHDRSPAANETVLDGSGDGTVISLQNCTSRVTRIDGFTVQNGVAASVDYLEWLCGGGGICSLDSAITISNNAFYNNACIGYGSGGAICCTERKAVVWNNTFGKPDDITGEYSNGLEGVAKAIYFVAMPPGTLIADNAVYGQNDVFYSYEIMYCDSSPTIAGNIIDSKAGGIAADYIQSQSAGLIARNTLSIGSGMPAIACYSESTTRVVGNTISLSATGTDTSTGILLTHCSPVICDNTIQAEASPGPCNGISLEQDGTPVIERNTFADLSARAISLRCGASAIIRNNLFLHNHTTGADGIGGGAIYSTNSTATIVNNTFVENWVGSGTWPNISPAGYGGAVHVTSPNAPQKTVTLINNIFYGNRAEHGDSVGVTDSAIATISYCDAWPGLQWPNYVADFGGTYTLSNMLYADPLFADPAAGQYWLQPTSGLRSQGTYLQANPIDITGCPRPGTDGYTDPGAYESDPGNY